MGKEGKVDIFSVIILSTVIFAIYGVVVLGYDLDVSINADFPINSTNASASFGYADGAAGFDRTWINSQRPLPIDDECIGRKEDLLLSICRSEIDCPSKNRFSVWFFVCQFDAPVK